jgi:hypothetical protein
MADQRDRQQSGRTEQNDEIEQGEQSGGKRVVGRGMTSPDSTEAVLDATTGEPDPRARGEGSNAEKSRSRDSGNV